MWLGGRRISRGLGGVGPVRPPAGRAGGRLFAGARAPPLPQAHLFRDWVHLFYLPCRADGALGGTSARCFELNFYTIRRLLLPSQNYNININVEAANRYRTTGYNTSPAGAKSSIA